MPETNPYYTGPESDHFNGVNFFNPGGTPPRNLGDLLRWQFGFSGGEGEPRNKWPETYSDAFRQHVPEAHLDGDALRVVMVGHASMLIQAGRTNMLTDPVWSDRASPVTFAGPKRVNRPGIGLADLPRIHVVLVSHNHYDHLDIATLKDLVAKDDPLVVTPLGNDTIIRKEIPSARLAVLDWGGTLETAGVAIHAEPAHHWSARGMRDRRMALWASFVIETQHGRIYHVGDTGFHDGINYEAAGRKHGGFRLAILPVGAYEPRWFMKGQHQNPAEAVAGMQLARADHAVGHHWGTFQLTNEAVESPRLALEAALDSAGIGRDRFRPLLPADVWDAPSA